MVERVGIALMIIGALIVVVTAIDRWTGDESADRDVTVEPAPGATGAPTDGATTTDVTGVPPAIRPEGFTTIRARVTEANGEVCEVCLWLADDSDERGRGLMGVTDLGDAVGMAFRFDEARIGTFYMFQTPTPLSIAWFGPDGAFVGAADMEPCLDTAAGDCPLYSPDLAYDLAIEVFQGGLEPLGLGPGSTVELLEGSEADRCPAAS